jgi:hypothetical protein
VQWQVLVRKYEERFGSRLDIAALGHSSPLAAATALLWEVLRLVDREDTDNPVLAVEDEVALTPQPGQLGRWPSIYRALCEIVLAHGTPEAKSGDDSGDAPSSRSILLSQLRPLLERHWHTNFDESALGFLNEEGTFLRLKKMKHLLHALLRWREQRLAWQRNTGLRLAAVDEALVPTLEVVPSAKHNDLVLRCCTGPTAPLQLWAAPAVLSPIPSSSGQKAEPTCSAAAVALGDAGDLRRELELLRGENEKLRTRNELLELGSVSVQSSPMQMMSSPRGVSVGEPAVPQFPADILDDPFEPPPEAQSWVWQEPLGMTRKLSHHDFGSTDAGSEASFDTSSVSSRMSATFELRSGLVSEATSGAITPVHVAPAMQQGCTFVPVWFPMMHSASNFFDASSVIPRGIVQSAREQFERLAGQ